MKQITKKTLQFMGEVQAGMPDGIKCYTPEQFNEFLDEEDDAWDEDDYFLIALDQTRVDELFNPEGFPILFMAELDEDTGTPSFAYYLPPGPIFENVTDLLIFIKDNL